jgi:quercetin dioxygenase-like cupin family protein
MERTPHTVSGPVLVFRLDDEIGRLRRERSRTGDRNAITLEKEGALRLVVVVLARGATMAEHATPGPATVHVLAGRVRIDAPDDVWRCAAGDIVVFDRRVEHSVTAEDEATLLVTVVDPRAAPSA